MQQDQMLFKSDPGEQDSSQHTSMDAEGIIFCLGEQVGALHSLCTLHITLYCYVGSPISFIS